MSAQLMMRRPSLTEYNTLQQIYADPRAQAPGGSLREYLETLYWNNNMLAQWQS